MKFLAHYIIAAAASFFLLAGSAVASISGSPSANAIKNNTAIVQDEITIIIEPRYIETKAKRRQKNKVSKSRLTSIRNDAIDNTLNGLARLRPYTTNYHRLKAAVRRYWKRNITHPTTNGLAKTMMRYVRKQDKDLVRSQVYSGARRGVDKVKRALRRRR